MEQFSVLATITRISTTRDHGLRLNVETQEISFEEKAKLLSLADKYGYFFFAEEMIKEINTKDLPPIILKEGKKSKSKLLRDILFIYYEQNIGNKKTFDEFYDETMDRYIDSVKEKLI